MSSTVQHEVKQSASSVSVTENDKSPASPNFLLRAIQRHYSNVEPRRTQRQIENDRYIFGNRPFNRWLLFPAAVIIQFCCGSLYAWSVFNAPIDLYVLNIKATGNTADPAPVTFYIAIGFFGISAASMGPWLERNGPRNGVFLGSLLFLLGNLISALAIYLKLMGLLYFGYGVVAGFGLGLSYISPVSALQKWFPDYRGMAAGFAVCGFGAGSIAIAKLPLPLIELVNLPLTFVILGFIYFVPMVVSAFVLRIPPPDYTVGGLTSDRERVAVSNIQTSAATEAAISSSSERRQSEPTHLKLTLIESLSSKEYKLLYVAFFANSIFGLVVIARLANMVTDIFDKGKDTASTIVSINGGFNLFGRLFFATLSDYFGRKTCFGIMLTLQSVGLILLPFVLDSGTYWAFLMIIWIMTACYGAGFGVIPAFLTDLFGSKNIGACHGIALLAWAIAGVGGGLVFTAVYDNLITGHGYTKHDPYIYNVNFRWLLALCLIGWVTLFFIPTTVQDRLLPPVKGEIARLRVFGRLLRISTSHGIELLSKEEEDRIWTEFRATNQKEKTTMSTPNMVAV